MMKEKAIVVAVEHEQITVTSEIKSACSGCQQVDNCGSGQISKAIPQRKLTMDINSKLALKVGDEVLIGLSEKKLLRTAFQVYLWPLLGLILFALIGQYLMIKSIFTSELLVIALSFIGGYLGFYAAKYQQSRYENSSACETLQTVILSKVSV